MGVGRVEGSRAEDVLSEEVPSAPSVSSSAEPATSVEGYVGPSPRPATSSQADAAGLDDIKQLLSTDVNRLDFMVTEAEAKSALGALSRYSPNDFRAAVGELQRDGSLQTMIEKLPWADQIHFLEVANAKGYLEKEAGASVVGKCDPPRHPDLYREEAQLPRVVNDLIHEHSKAVVADYKTRYDAYVDRYSKAVNSCADLQQIRALGKPADPAPVWELSDHSDPGAKRYAADWNLSASESSPLHAYAAVSDRMQALQGERRDGSFWFEAKAEGQVMGLAFELDVKTGDPSRETVKVNGGLAAKVELGKGSLTRREMLDGKSKSTVKAGSAFSASVTEKHGKVTGASVNVALPVGPAVNAAVDDGRTRLGISPVQFSANGGRGELGSYAALDAQKAELSGGLRTKLAIGSTSDLEARVGFGEKGLSAAAADAAWRDEGIFSRPPELEAKAAWSQLPEGRRSALSMRGWTDAEWVREGGRP